MKGGANVQARNAETGWVPLHDAASRGHSEVVQVLLSLNVPVHPRTPNGETPLMLAQPFPECVKILRRLTKKYPWSFLFYIFSEQYQTMEPVLKKSDWYHGTLDRREAVELLSEHGNQEGSYLVRYSDKHGGMNVLTMIVGDHTYHYHIKTKVCVFLIGCLTIILNFVVG